MKKHYGIRWSFFIIGLAIFALGTSLTIKGQKYGIGPWDVLHVGLYKNFGLTIGSWSILMGLFILVVTSIILKEFPKIGAIGNMLLIGTFIDFFNFILPNIESSIGQLISFVLGVAVIGVGGAIYITAKLGAGPRDNLMLIAVKNTKLSIRSARTLIELIVGIIGYLIGGPIGVGTIIMIVGLGPVIQWAFVYTDRLYEKLTTEKNLELHNLD